MKQSQLTQAIHDLTQDNPVVNMMDTIFTEAFDKQFNEVFGPSSKCTLGGFWSDEPVCINLKLFEEFLPTTVSILERLEYDMMVHDQTFRAIMHDLNPAPYTPYTRHLNELISPFSQGSRRSDVHTTYYHGSLFNV